VSKPGVKRVNVALQGGGALGAFTWGVLDRLLEDDRIEIAAVSGASAGAMNAVVLADGIGQGAPDEGRRAARAALRRFWEGVARAGASSPYRRTPLMKFLGAFAPAWASWGAWADAMTRVASPYDLNPLNINPLRDVVDELVDFERVRGCERLGVFIAATNVETGTVRVFKRGELTADHVMASACLPLIFQAVEIDGAPYWDGGYMGNPPLFPLFDANDSADVLIVQINPLVRKGAPRAAADILARIDEITFNASLLRELRAIEFVQRLLAENRVEKSRYRDILVHVIEDERALAGFGASADTNTDLAFF
jgi:NTE family protein